MSDTTQYEPIPQPPEHLFGLLGNLPDVDPNFMFKDVRRLQSLYGPIFKLNLARPQIFLASQKLVHETSDPKLFHKVAQPSIVELRALMGDGLFTAADTEMNWWKAHRLLVPAFGPIGLRKMFDDMYEIGTQLVLKWDRLGPSNEIDASEDLTRLAFDTIGLCAFSFRFNDFYQEKVHPFATRMSEVLLASGRRALRPHLIRPLYRSEEQQRQDNVQEMHKLCDEIVADRRKNPQPDAKDLLNIMLNGVDRETGEQLSDENIRYQMTTFLVAGHETTSGTLSFTYHNLLKNPEKLLKAQQQVDEVVGDGVLTPEHLSKLDYIDACIKETLRLNTPVSAYTQAPREDTVIGGKYFIPKDSLLTVNLKGLHQDPEVWGDDADVFRPERFLNGGLQALPPDAFKPFGHGMRACIGRGFAEQEMLINITLVLQRFQLELADPSYKLQLKATMTTKPDNFRIRVRRRPGKSINVGLPGAALHPEQHGTKEHQPQPAKGDRQLSKQGLSIFFGGNSGTCEALAQTLATSADHYGIDASIAGLDAATEDFPSDRPMVIITSSYEGQPPDNAKKFVSWLQGLKKEDSPLKAARYAVFGVGNSDWSSTFHRIPTLVDRLMEEAGASRIFEFGSSNVKTDLIGPWEDWSEKLLATLSGSSDRDASTSNKTNVEINIQRNPLSKTLGGESMTQGIVVKHEELAGTEAGLSKRHIEIRLPENMQYTSGDYLVVQPYNPAESVQRVTTIFGLDKHDLFSATGSSKTFLPATPTPIGEFLTSSVELASPVTKRQLATIMTYAKPDQKDELEKLELKDLLEKRYSILDVLEEHAVDLPFNEYVDMLSPLTPRQYSISSSPLHLKDKVSLTYDVHQGPSFSGHSFFQGVASTYLASLRVGDRVSCFVRPTNVGFRMPEPQTPLIMIAAGTGIAPMRAFLQERAAIAAAGVLKLGPAVLYFGCRHPDKDFIYKDELQEWERQGIVTLRPAFSKMDGAAPQYVQDAIWEHRDEVASMFHDGGKIFLCGSASKLAKSSAEVCKKIYSDRTGSSADAAEEWLENAKTSRYISDVY